MEPRPEHDQRPPPDGPREPETDGPREPGPDGPAEREPREADLLSLGLFVFFVALIGLVGALLLVPAVF